MAQLKFKKITGLVAGLLVASLLAACSDTTPTPPPATPTAPVTSAPTTAPGTTAVISLAPGPSVTPARTATTTTGTVEPDAQKAVRAALQQMAGTSYRYTVRQKITVNSGGAASNLTGEGEGLVASPNLSQKMALAVNGQSQDAEILTLDNATWQRLSTLAVWRKVGDELKYSPNPPATLADKATGTQTNGSEQVNGQDTRKYTLTLPADLFLTGQGGAGPDALGLLSATGMGAALPGLLPGGGSLQIVLWLDSSGNRVIQRQTTLKLGDPANNLTFESLYTYRDFSAPGLSVTPPPNFPKP